MNVLGVVVRVALCFGLLIDGVVGLLCVFAQPLIPGLLGIDVHDPPITTFLGGELLVVALVYALALTDPRRWNALLWLCAFDQALAVVLPLAEIARGRVLATWQTLGPIPLQLCLVVCLVVGARTMAAGSGNPRRDGPG